MSAQLVAVGNHVSPSKMEQEVEVQVEERTDSSGGSSFKDSADVFHNDAQEGVAPVKNMAKIGPETSEIPLSKDSNDDEKGGQEDNGKHGQSVGDSTASVPATAKSSVKSVDKITAKSKSGSKKAAKKAAKQAAKAESKAASFSGANSGENSGAKSGSSSGVESVVKDSKPAPSSEPNTLSDSNPIPATKTTSESALGAVYSAKAAESAKSEKSGKYEKSANPKKPANSAKPAKSQVFPLNKTDAPSSPAESSLKLPARTFVPLSIDTDGSSGIPFATAEALSLLEARQLEISITFDAKDASLQRAINTGVESVKNTYREIRNTIGHLPSELLGSEPIDWALWDRVIDDYHEIIIHDPQHLSQAVAAGIPEEIRGIVWQLVARLKNLQLEELYMHLKTEASVHEKAIKRDLTRTSFYTNVDAANKALELYNVILAYLNFDPDVGYTQGMVFIAVPLIMNMTESECFCLLVTLMKEYGLRELFCPEMRGLHLLLHQFDRLLELQLPVLYNHLHRQGIRLLMYASQWFLTFFSYKFPLKVVLRIFDMVITQGIEAVLRLGLNLMLKNERSLVRLNFDGLLDFLKDSLFNIYISDEFVSQEPQTNKRFSLLARKPATKSDEYYKLDAFIGDSMQVDVSPLDLARWRAEFDQILQKDCGRAEEIEALRAVNGKLRHEIKDLEMKMYTLNHDHLESVQSLVSVKVALPELLGDIDELQGEVSALEKSIQELELKLGGNNENIPQDIEAQIHELLAQNAQETERFSSLEEQLNELTLQNDALDAALKSNKKWFWKKKSV